MSEYINNKEFLILIVHYQKTKCRVTYNKIGRKFISLATNILNKPNFINYTQDRKDEMISEATFDMCRYVTNFDENKSDNPFAYFTRAAYNAFNRYFNKHKKIEDKFINLSFIENFDGEI